MRSRSIDFKNKIYDVVNDWKRNAGRTPSLKEIGDELGVNKSTIYRYLKKELIVATKEQWDQVLKTNRTLPREQRRFFVCDSFEDCGEIDRMFIETEKKEYDKWHSEHEMSERNRKCGNQYEFVSTSQGIPRTELTYEDIIAADYSVGHYEVLGYGIPQY